MNFSKLILAESWARGVEWELTRMIYPDYLGRERRTNDYTLVVADLIDNSYTEKNKLWIWVLFKRWVKRSSIWIYDSTNRRCS